jgi:hypothetical protein
MYIPKNRIKSNLYTGGGEWVIKSSNENYIGFFHSLFTGKSFTGKTQNEKPTIEIILQTSIVDNVWSQTSEGKEFQQYADNYDSEVFQGQYQDLNDIAVYNYITNTDISKTRLTPQQHFPNPTLEDYALGSFTRYFCVKINQPLYLELNKETYNFIKNQDMKYLWEPYKVFKVQWTLVGNEKEVFNTNRNVILLLEKRSKLRGLQRFLKENYLKFYK